MMIRSGFDIVGHLQHTDLTANFDFDIHHSDFLRISHHFYLVTLFDLFPEILGERGVQNLNKCLRKIWGKVASYPTSPTK